MKKTVKIILISLSSLLLLCGIIGFSANCSSSESNTRYYTVTFDMGENGTSFSSHVKENDIVQKPLNSHSGFLVTGWYLNDEVFNFSTPITEDIVLKANLRKDLVMDTNTFEVYSYVVNNNPIGNGYFLDLSDVCSSFDFIYLNGRLLNENDYSFSNGILKIYSATFNSSFYGEVTIKIVDGRVSYYKILKNVITKQISSKADLSNMLLYGGLDPSSDDKCYDGYFILTNNIDMCASDFDFPRSGQNISDFSEVRYTNTTGFKGIFDGQGYSIYNIPAFEHLNGGIFGNVISSGIVRNTGFIGKVQATSWGRHCILGGFFMGLLDNCYFDITFTKSHYNSYSSPTAVWLCDATFSNVVIRLDSSILTHSYGSRICHYYDSACTFKNVYSFFVSGNEINYDGRSGKADISSGCYRYGYDDLIEEIPFADTSMWDLTDGYLSFKSSTTIVTEETA